MGSVILRLRVRLELPSSAAEAAGMSEGEGQDRSRKSKVCPVTQMFQGLLGAEQEEEAGGEGCTQL